MSNLNKKTTLKSLISEESIMIAGGCSCICRLNQGEGWHLLRTTSAGSQPDTNACMSACRSMGHSYYSCN